MTLLLTSIALFSLVALGSYIYCWWDIKRGTPHLLSLRQITLIMDRYVLNEMFGKHRAGYRYTLSPAMVNAVLQARSSYMFTQVTAELCCLIGAYRYLSDNASLQTLPLFLVLALVCEGVDIWFSIRLARRWWWQIQEEMDNIN